MGLSDSLRTRFERRGRVVLSTDEATALTRSKTVHIVAILAAVYVSMWVAREPIKNFETNSLLDGITGLMFFLAGIAQSIVPGTSAFDMFKRIGTVMCSFVLGSILLIIVRVLSVSILSS